MYCNKCGDIVENGEQYCNKCGNLIIGQPINSANQMNPSYQYNNQYVTNNSNKQKKQIIILSVIGIMSILIIVLGVIVAFTAKNIYFSDTDYDDEEVSETNNDNPYKTSIVHDNQYERAKIDGKSGAMSLIIKDSNDQKKKCTHKGIETVENNIQDKYGITAVNLCELDLSFAKETENVIKKIYDEFPKIRGYLTNLSLYNDDSPNGSIAYFQSIFIFATSNSPDEYPYAVKTQIMLNSSSYLNLARFQKSIEFSSKSGHFPKNANIYSPVAHEFAHYISFLVEMKRSKLDDVLIIDNLNIAKVETVINNHHVQRTSQQKLITEAYNNYMSKYPDSKYNEYDFRASISGYALAKNDAGEYLYDETIAEAFHDYYLNGKEAAKASLEIVAVLKKYVEDNL